MHKSKLTQIGNSVGIVLPKEVLAHLKLDKGDVVAIVPTPTGAELRSYDPEFESDMKKVDGILKRYRNAFRELAK